MTLPATPAHDDLSNFEVNERIVSLLDEDDDDDDETDAAVLPPLPTVVLPPPPAAAAAAAASGVVDAPDADGEDEDIAGTTGASH